MTQARRSSKRKRAKAALAWGAAGVSLAMTGAASATAPATNVPSQDNARRLILAEEEISDVSLATFYAVDHERQSGARRVRVAMAGGCGCGCGCGGCGGCWAGDYFGYGGYGPPPLFHDGPWPPAPVKPVRKYRHTYR